MGGGHFGECMYKSFYVCVDRGFLELYVRMKVLQTIFLENEKRWTGTKKLHF